VEQACLLVEGENESVRLEHAKGGGGGKKVIKGDGNPGKEMVMAVPKNVKKGEKWRRDASRRKKS